MPMGLCILSGALLRDTPFGSVPFYTTFVMASLGVLIPNGCAVGAAFAACNAASVCNHGYPQNLATSMPAFYTGQKEQTAEQSKLR